MKNKKEIQLIIDYKNLKLYKQKIITKTIKSIDKTPGLGYNKDIKRNTN